MQNLKQKLKQFIFLFILTLAVVNPTLVLAATNSNTNSATAGGIGTTNYSGVDTSISKYLCTPTETEGSTTASNSQDLAICINKIYRFGVAFGAIAVVFFIVFAGYMYITGGEAAKTKAKTMIQNAIIGIALILGSYLILSFINPNLIIYKPIQPPIFSAPDLPDCEEVGFGEQCVLPDGTTVGSGSGGWGTRLTCPGNKMVSAKGLGLPTKQSDNQICEPFGQQLVKIKPLLTGLNWYITSTVDGTHISQCHKPGGPYSGTCADLGISDKTPANWSKVCKALLSIGQLQPVNEATKDATDCPAYQTYATTNGQNVHVNWREGGGSTTGGTTSGGSRPNCTAVSGVPGVCANPGKVSGTWDNTKPELKQAFDTLSKQFKVTPSDRYRSPEYSAFLRSVFEAYELSHNHWTDAEIKSYGQYCSSSGIQYVTAANAANQAVYDWAEANKKHFGDLGNPTSPTTCKSDHSQGIAMDIDPPNISGSKAFQAAAKKAGLCHDVPSSSAHGVTMKPDVRHYALISSGVTCVDY